jgi:hypothetical protein
LRLNGLSLPSLAIGHGIFNLAVGVIFPPTVEEPAALIVAPLGLLTITAAMGWAFHAVREHARAAASAEMQDDAIDRVKAVVPRLSPQPSTDHATKLPDMGGA